MKFTVAGAQYEFTASRLVAMKMSRVRMSSGIAACSPVGRLPQTILDQLVWIESPNSCAEASRPAAVKAMPVLQQLQKLKRNPYRRWTTCVQSQTWPSATRCCHYLNEMGRLGGWECVQATERALSGCIATRATTDAVK
jgi:hypothetical protein